MSWPNEPAFPRAPYRDVHGGFEPGTDGLTKREFFAAAALQGLCANPKFSELSSEYLAVYAREHADETLAQLEKVPA